jgi:thiosulfate/3-mercaptopyruvate sulfurtransferase
LTEPPLISVDELAARIDEPAVRVVDVRWVLGKPGAGRAAYDAGHIPGALFLDLDTDLADPAGLGAPGRHPLPDPDLFARRLGERGIGTDDLVVAYDDVGGWVAARLWWMLDDLGHDRVRVLDGGYPAWLAAGLPSTAAVTERAPATLELASRWSRVIERDDLRDRLGSVVLLDARAAARYRGDVEPVDPVAGHVPTARSAPTDGNLDADLRFRTPAELATRFADLGADGSREVVTSCGSGTAACHHALAMRIAGVPDPTLYAGSYSDWSRSGYPVVTGDEPGGPPG